MCVVGLGNALVDTGLHTLPARLVPEHLLARVFGVKAKPGRLVGGRRRVRHSFAIALLGVRGALAVPGSSPLRPRRLPGGVCAHRRGDRAA